MGGIVAPRPRLVVFLLSKMLWMCCTHVGYCPLVLVPYEEPRVLRDTAACFIR